MNQFIAHHSIIFQPKKLLVWVSTSPWQLGEYVCYDLNKIFVQKKPAILYEEKMNIQADTILKTSVYGRIAEYLRLEKLHMNHQIFDPLLITSINPNYYDSYRIAGDIYTEMNKKDSAIWMYKQSLNYEIATLDEKKSIENKISKLSKN